MSLAFSLFLVLYIIPLVFMFWVCAMVKTTLLGYLLSAIPGYNLFLTAGFWILAYDDWNYKRHQRRLRRKYGRVYVS